MGRPKEFEETEVLDKAIDAFWERGFDGVSVQNLCATMGLNPGSLYGAFGDKRGLFLASLDRYVDTVSRQALDLIASGPTGLAGIRAYFDYLSKAIRTGKRRWGCLVTNSIAWKDATDPDVMARADKQLRRLETAFAQALTRAKADGQLPSSAGVSGAALLLVCVVQGLNVLARTRPTRARVEAIVGAALSALTGHGPF